VVFRYIIHLLRFAACMLGYFWFAADNTLWVRNLFSISDVLSDISVQDCTVLTDITSSFMLKQKFCEPYHRLSSVAVFLEYTGMFTCALFRLLQLSVTCVCVKLEFEGMWPQEPNCHRTGCCTQHAYIAVKHHFKLSVTC
jgi:hypothetical protein